MGSAYFTDIVRSVRGSLGRFLAIMGIVALGCGFYAGLQMCGPNMRADADAFYDGTNLWDLRLISTLGFEDADVDRVRVVEGVSHVMPSLTCDAMARMGTEQIAVRISTLDPARAQASWDEGLYEVRSNDPDYLNRPRLVEGRWPQGPSECVICADLTRTDYGIGDTVTLLYGVSDLDELLQSTNFQIVGTVSSSNYPYTGSFGSTTLGSGMIDQYLYVDPAALAPDAPYTEIYLTVEGAAEELSESDAYLEVVGRTKARLEALADELSASRQGDLKARAQETLDEKWAEYHSELERVERELADAKAQLDDAAAQIADGETELADGERQYAEGKAEFEEQRADAYGQLDDAERELESGQALLDEKRAELERGERELQESRAALDDGERQLGMSQQEIDAAFAQLAESEQAWTAQRAQLKGMRDKLSLCVAALQSVRSMEPSGKMPSADEFSSYVEDMRQGINALQALRNTGLLDKESEQAVSGLEILLQNLVSALERIEIDDQTTAESFYEQLREVDEKLYEQIMVPMGQFVAKLDNDLAQGDGQVAGARAQLDQAQAARNEIDAGRVRLAEGEAQLADGRRQLEEGQWQLDEGRAELEEGRATAERELASAQAQLDDAAAQLADARSQLADAREQYADGLRSYEKGRAEADEEFADALAQLEDAQHKIDTLEQPDIYALDRTKSEGAVTYHADAGRIDAIADVFPFMFFLVAALVALTTMTRMVEDDRVLIGTYKALGYGTVAIAGKYLAYAGIAGSVGALVGILTLCQVLPLIVMNAYSIIYTVPIHPFPLPIHADIALAAGGLGVGVTMMATFGAVLSSLREVPATLMLPRAPKAGKRILLERISFVWRRLSFTWKVTIRNLFRYKRRFFMTVVGISGCTALLLVGFGLHDSIWDIIDCQFGPILHYDTTIGLDDKAIETDVRRVCSFLEQSGETSGITRMQVFNKQAGVEGNAETIRVNAIVPRDAANIADTVTFRNRVSGVDIAFDDDSVLVTEKLALKYGLSEGDVILLFDQDDVGNAIGTGHSLRITGVTENYVGNYVYVGRNAWRQVSEDPLVFSTIYATTTADEQVRKSLTDDLQQLGCVSTVVFSDETMNMYRNMLSVVDMIVVVLIVSAAALAYIVLYNLTNINIGERIREIASLKVLGFTRGEVYSYIFREILLLAVIGDVLGLALGIFLERFVVTTAEVDYVMFGRSIHPPSFAYSFALTMLFACLVVFSMRRKLDRVDMVESLKSVD